MYNWFKAAAIRAIKTAAQSAAAIVGTSTFMGEVDWIMVISAAGVAAILSLLMSVAGLPEVDGGTSPLSTGKLEKADAE